MNLSHYIFIADLFEYPGEAFPGKVSKVQKYLDEKHPEAGKMLKDFTQFTAKATTIEMEELFTRSFDVQAVTTLDTGYVLFGDDYKRGELLVNLNREHLEVGNDCNNELADHLPNVLRLIPKMTDDAIRDELAEKMLCPAVRKMIEEFNPEKIKLKTKIYKKHHKTIIERSKEFGTLYRNALQALYKVLQNDFVITEKKEKEQTSDFLKSVRSEMEIEKE